MCYQQVFLCKTPSWHSAVSTSYMNGMGGRQDNKNNKSIVRIIPFSSLQLLKQQNQVSHVQKRHPHKPRKHRLLAAPSPRQKAVGTRAAPPHEENNEREAYLRKSRRDCTEAWSQVWTPPSFLPSCVSHPSAFSEALPLCGKQNRQKPKSTALPTAFEFPLTLQKMIWEEKDKIKS